MKSDAYYSGRDIESPERIKKPALPGVGHNVTSSELSECAKALREYELKQEKYKEDHSIYMDKIASRSGEFSGDLSDEYRLPWMNDATWSKITSKAYSDGHSSGYDSVRYITEELVDFADELHTEFLNS